MGRARASRPTGHLAAGAGDQPGEDADVEPSRRTGRDPSAMSDVRPAGVERVHLVAVVAVQRAHGRGWWRCRPSTGPSPRRSHDPCRSYGASRSAHAAPLTVAPDISFPFSYRSGRPASSASIRVFEVPSVISVTLPHLRVPHDPEPRVAGGVVHQPVGHQRGLHGVERGVAAGADLDRAEPAAGVVVEHPAGVRGRRALEHLERDADDRLVVGVPPVAVEPVRCSGAPPARRTAGRTPAHPCCSAGLAAGTPSGGYPAASSTAAGGNAP